MTEDEMVGWHHQLNGHEFEQTLGDGGGQGSLVCCSPWGCKESDVTEQLNNNVFDPFQVNFCEHLQREVQFHFEHVVIQFSQHHLLKRLSWNQYF